MGCIPVSFYMHKLLYVLCFEFYFEAKMNLKWFYVELECAVDEMSELLSSEKCFSF